MLIQSMFNVQDLSGVGCTPVSNESLVIVLLNVFIHFPNFGVNVDSWNQIQDLLHTYNACMLRIRCCFNCLFYTCALIEEVAHVQAVFTDWLCFSDGY